ncbi:MAG: LysR family transcriptional regulator [Gracilibacteraceae bacterium]|jgi:DNA-binding transcriptional LysR family regulator|nr:LysR family transcriptional regulator [Gracilibacteraceae bacterium]
MIKTEQLFYLIAVADSRSFALAAQKLYITQPALSVAVKKLEDELGIRLFDRTPSAVLMTEAGEYVYRQAKTVLAALEEMRETARAYLPKSETGEYVFYASGNLFLTFLSSLAAAVKRVRPLLCLIFKEERQETMLEAVAGDSHSYGLLYAEDKAKFPAGIEAQTIAVIRPFLLCHRDHPYAGKKRVDFASLLKVPLIFFTGPAVSNEKILAELRRYGEPDVTMAPTLNQKHHFVNQNLACCIDTDQFQNVVRQNTNLDLDSVVFVPIRTNLRFALYLLSHREADPEVTAFLYRQCRELHG